MSIQYQEELGLSDYIKTLLYSSVGYLVIVLSISGFHYDILEEKEESLSMIENQLVGVAYLKTLQEVSIGAAHYQDNWTQKLSPVVGDIETLYQAQNDYPQFTNKKFNQTLQKIQNNNIPLK